MRWNKESLYVVGYGYEMGFNEFGIGRTRFNAIFKSKLDDREDSFNCPSFTVQP